MTKLDIVKEALSNIFGFLNVNPEHDLFEEDGTIKVIINGNDLSFLIGYRGTSLDALESLLGIMLFKATNESTPVMVDINGYRAQKIERLQGLARRLIDKVRFFQNDVELPSMEPWERRQVHMLVTEYDDIVSESTGEGKNRRVVLKLKK